MAAWARAVEARRQRRVAAVKVERRGWWRRRWSPITAPDGEGDGGPPAAVRRGLGARGGRGVIGLGLAKTCRRAGSRDSDTRTRGGGRTCGLSAGCAWLIGGARWLGAGRKLAHRGRAVDQLVTPAPQTLCSSSNRAAGDSQPPAHRLGTTQDPAGDVPAEGRVARRVIHALIDRLIQFLCSRAVLHAAEDPLFTATCGENGVAMNRRRTVGPKV